LASARCHADEYWKVRCITCWKESKRGNLYPGSENVRHGAQLRAMLVQNEIPVFTAEIPNLVAFDKASAEGVPVYEVDDPRAQRAWEAYELAGKEIL
jgi:cellulose biosynthesis protein BcsQ